MHKFTRRKLIVDSLTAALVTPCWNGPWLTSHTAFAAGGKVRYIDIHTHVGAFYQGRELTAELLVQFMDMHGIEKAVRAPFDIAGSQSHSPADGHRPGGISRVS